jgi:hypothetical protein
MRYGAAAPQPHPAQRLGDEYYGGAPRCCGIRRQRRLVRPALAGMMLTVVVLFAARQRSGDDGSSGAGASRAATTSAASFLDAEAAPPPPSASDCPPAAADKSAAAAQEVGPAGEQLAAARSALAAARSDLLAALNEAGLLRNELTAAKAAAAAAAAASTAGAGQPGEPPLPDGCPPPAPHAPPPPCPVCPPHPPPPPPCPSQTPEPETLQPALAQGGVPSQQAQPFDASVLYTPAGHAHDAVDALGLPDAGLARATRAAQRALRAHQFPHDGCSGKRFLTSAYLSGLGSMMHVASYHLALAVADGRILLWHPSMGAVYTGECRQERHHMASAALRPSTRTRPTRATRLSAPPLPVPRPRAPLTHTLAVRADDATCPDAHNFECFFQPPSSCTLADAVAAGADILALGASSGRARTHGCALCGQRSPARPPFPPNATPPVFAPFPPQTRRSGRQRRAAATPALCRTRSALSLRRAAAAAAAVHRPRSVPTP